MNLISKYFLLFCSCLFLNTFCVSAEMSFKTLPVRDGLELYELKAINRDTLGFVWLGNARGLSRFDGREVKLYPIPGYAKPFVSSIHELDKSRLLVCSSRGVFEFHRNTGKYIHIAKYRDSLDISSMAISPDKNSYYLGSFKWFDVYNVRDKKIKRYSITHYGVSIRILDLIYGGGMVWMGTSNGVCQYNPQNKSFRIVTSGRLGKVNKILLVHDSLFIGTESGLYIYDVKKGKCQSVSQFDNLIVTSIAKGRGNQLYVGTNGFGIASIDLATLKIREWYNHIKKREGGALPSNSVYTIFYDKEDVLWAGFHSAGVSFSQHYKSKFSLFAYGGSDELKGLTARAICVSGGVKLIGTRDGLIVSESSGKSTLYSAGIERKGLRANIILSICPYPGHSGQFLVCTYGGGISVFDLNTRRFTEFINHKSMLYGKIYGVCSDRHGFLWIATLDGLYKCDVSGKPYVVHLIKTNSFSAIHYDRYGRIWLGSDRGLAVLDTKTENFIEVEYFNSIIKGRTVSINGDDRGNVWVCVTDGGLYAFDTHLHLVKHYTNLNGLPDNSVVSTLQDRKGDLWIATVSGFARLSGGAIWTFSLSDGLPGEAFMPSACSQDADGNLWFGAETGLMYFNPEQIQKNNRSPLTVISGVEVNNGIIEPVVKSKKNGPFYTPVSIKGKSNTLKIEFAALNFFNPEDNRFRFILKGYDKKWRVSGRVDSVEYKDLHSGHYVFLVYGANNDGVWSKTPAVLPVQVRYYFYQTIWFIIFCIFLFAACGYWGFRYYFRHTATKLKEQLLSSLPKKEKREPSKPKFGEDRNKEIVEIVRIYMQDQKPYLDVNFKFSKLAEAVNLSQVEISQAITQIEGQSFSDFVNRYRVAEFIEQYKNDLESKLKITSIAFDCGFYSKASFYRAFKKATGMAPGEYFKDSDIKD